MLLHVSKIAEWPLEGCTYASSTPHQRLHDPKVAQKKGSITMGFDDVGSGLSGSILVLYVRMLEEEKLFDATVASPVGSCAIISLSVKSGERRISRETNTHEVD